MTYLFLLLVEVVNDHTNEEIEGEEGAKDDENHKVDVHVDVNFIVGLVSHLGAKETGHRVARVQFIILTVAPWMGQKLNNFFYSTKAIFFHST